MYINKCIHISIWQCYRHLLLLPANIIQTKDRGIEMNKYLIEINKIFELNWFSKFMQFFLRQSDGTMLPCLLRWFNRWHSTTHCRGGRKGLRMVLCQIQMCDLKNTRVIYACTEVLIYFINNATPTNFYFSMLHWLSSWV